MFDKAHSFQLRRRFVVHWLSVVLLCLACIDLTLFTLHGCLSESLNESEQLIQPTSVRAVNSESSLVQLDDTAYHVVPSPTQFAYVTLLSTDTFLDGTLVWMESLRLSQTQQDIVVLVVPHVSLRARTILARFGAIVIEIDYITNPNVDKMRARRQVCAIVLSSSDNNDQDMYGNWWETIAFNDTIHYFHSVALQFQQAACMATRSVRKDSLYGQ
jgi:hypothetical protein